MLTSVVLLAAIATAAVEVAPTQGCVMVNVNILVDMMINYQDFRHKAHTKTINIEDTTLMLPSGEAEARNVTLRTVDALYRSGDCFVCKSSEKQLVDLELGWNFLELTIGSLTLSKEAQPFAASFKLDGVSVKLVLSFIGNSLTLDRLELLTLGEKVVMSASNPDYDGKDVTDIAREFVLPYVNDRLEQLRQELNKHSEDRQMMFQQLLS